MDAALKLAFIYMCFYMSLQRGIASSSGHPHMWDLPGSITKLTTDTSETIYIGGDNFVGTFSSKLNDSLSIISIGPISGADNCTPLPHPCNNTVNVLEVVEQLGMLLVCGTAYTGTCTVHNLGNLSDWNCLVGDTHVNARFLARVNNKANVVHIIPNDNILNISRETVSGETCRSQDFGYTTDSQTRVPSERQVTTEKNKTGPNAHSVQLIVVGEVYNPQSNIFSVISMRINSFINKKFEIQHVKGTWSKINESYIDDSGSKCLINFTYSFTWNSSTYTLSTQYTDNVNETIITKLGRWTIKDNNVIRFVETKLKCTANQQTYTVMTAAAFTNVSAPSNNGDRVPVLLVAFGLDPDVLSEGEPRIDGALCAFFLDDINQNLDTTLEACTRADHSLARPVDWIKSPKYNCQLTPLRENQSVYLETSRAEIKPSILNRASAITSLCISEAKANYSSNLYFVTSDGILEKIILNTDSMLKQTFDLRLEERFQVPYIKENVKLLVQLQQNFTYVYMVTGRQLIRRTVNDCQQFQGCGHCPSVMCKWCYSTRVCQNLGSLCQNNSTEVETSDEPWITPKYAPPTGGTVLTVHGLDLVNASSINTNIKVCDQPCEKLSSSNGSEITCRIEPHHTSNDGDSCKIILLITVNGQIRTLTIKATLTLMTSSIESFSPNTGHVSGGTVLEFKGCYLDIGSKTEVWLHDSRCELTELNRDRLKCTTNSKPVNSHECVSVRVLVDAFIKVKPSPLFCYSNISTNQDKFTLVTPVPTLENEHHMPTTSLIEGCLVATIDSFLPHFGPVSGGTILKFKTQNINATKDIKIMVGASNCRAVITDNQTLTCQVSRQANTTVECVDVQVFLNEAIQNISNPSFCYKPDPVVTQVKVDPIIHGKQTNITVNGSNFDSVTSSNIVIFYHDPVTNKSIHVKGDCFAENVTEVMTCVTPDLYDIVEKYFQLNESRDYLEVELALEMDNNYFNLTATSYTLIHRSPKFDNKSVPATKLSKDHPILVLWVQGLINFVRSDITVKVGSRVCPIVSMTNVNLTCNVTEVIDKYKSENGFNPGRAGNDSSKNNKNDGCSPLPSSEKDLQCSVKLKIGHNVTELGHVTISLAPMGSVLGPMKMAVLVGIGLAALVIVSLLIVTFVLLNRMKRSKTRKSDAVNEPCVDDNVFGSGEVTMPTLKQILKSVDVDVSKQEEMRKLIFDIDKLTIGKCIGSGNFGTVFDGVLELRPELPTEKVAVKMLQDPMSHRIDLLSFVQEAVMMRQFQHPNVLGLIGLAEQEPGIPLVILPFLENGDLLTYVRNESLSLTLHDVIKFGADIASGMAYLSSLKFVHRDLAARNCMLDSEYRVKVADFGLCRDIYEKGYYTSDNKKVLPIRWMALESIENGTYSTKSDVWSLGVVIWEMLTRGLTPYPGVDGWDVVNYLRHRRLPPPYFCPEPLFNLMMMCWANEPNMRPTFKAIQMELLLLIDGGRTDRVKEDKDDHSAKSDTLNASLPSKKHDTPVTENSGQSLTQKEDQQQGSSTNNAVVCNETPCNEQKPPSKEISSNCDKTTHAGEEITLAVGSARDTQVITRDIDSANRDTSSDVLSVPQPTVVEDVLITIPECYSHGDVSSKALGTYVELVANYEPPRSYLGSFLSPSPGCSANVPELIENTLSDAGRDYVWLSEEGAYYKADQDI